MEHTTIWHNLFVPDLSVAEKVIRPVLVYMFLIVAVRAAGRRELAQLNSVDLVVLMMLANTVQNATIGNDNSMIGGLIGVSALLLINYLVVRVLYRHPRLDRVLEGAPVELIRDGAILRAPLEREVITEEELMEAVRKQGLRDASDVDRAVLETGGTISVVPRRPTPLEQAMATLQAKMDAVGGELAEVRALLQERDGGAGRPS